MRFPPSSHVFRRFSRAVLISAAFLIGALAGCSAPPARPSPPATAAASNPLIVRLVSRHDVITITAGRTGPLYTIADASGRVLVSGMTMSDLKRARPDLYAKISPAVAPTAMVWAGD